ncbi:MAG: transporter [Thermoanaerobaculia bacterium]
MKHLAFRGLAGSDLEVDAIPLVVVWGATPKLTLFGITPLLDKQLTIGTPAGQMSRGDSGVGDLTLLARYTLWQRDSRGATFRVAPFVGVEAPTGRDDAKDALGSLPSPLQLGSGSWDPVLGLVVTRQTLGWQVDSSFSYQANTEANDFEIGDVARFDLSYQHRVRPRELSAGVPSFVYAVLESNVVWQDRHRAAGQEVSDSGGTSWYLAPGIQHVRKRLILEAAVQVPVAQSLHGSARESDWIGTVSLRFNF